MAGARPARRRPVLVFRTGERRWHHLPSWPPASAPAVFNLHASGALTLSYPTAETPGRKEPSNPDAGEKGDQESDEPTNPRSEVTHSRDFPADGDSSTAVPSTGASRHPATAPIGTATDNSAVTNES